MVQCNRLLLNVVVCLVTCFATTSVRAQQVPQSVRLINNGGTMVIPPARTAGGDMLRGRGDYFKGLGELYQGQGACLQQRGSYEVQHQNAERMRMENQVLKVEYRRQMREQARATIQATSDEREYRNIATDLRHFRDQPEQHHVASGVALNYMLKQFGPNLATVDFARVRLTTDELESIQLQTADGITADQLAWSFDAGGRVRWPEVLRLTEVSSQRARVEIALNKLRQIELSGEPTGTQVKYVSKEIGVLRSQAGYILRAKKNDEIGANASRDFLKHLDCQVARLRSSESQSRMRVALQPTVRSATELMQHVVRHNLKFAPSTDPTATAYRLLHERMADSHRELHRSSPSLAAAF